MTKRSTTKTMCRARRPDSAGVRGGALPPACLLLLLLTAAAPDPIVAERGTDAVTASQARALIASTEPETRRKLANPAAVTEFLRNYLLGRAVLATAQAQHWDQRPEIAALLQRSRDSALAQSFLAAQAAPPASYPSAAEIQAAYEANKAQLLQPRSYHLTQITLPVAATAPPATLEDARRKLADVRAQLPRGHIAFETAAGRLAGAQYGDLGWLPETRLQSVARDAVSGLLDGQVSGPVCTKAGCALLKMVATRPAGPPALADIRDNLVTALRQRKEREGEQAYANTLMAREPVRVNEIELGELVKAPAK